MQKPTLNQRQQAFVNAYLVSGNATRAAIEAGYSERRAEVTGSELVGNRKVAAAIAERRAKAEQKADITREKVLRELAKIGFSDIRKVFTPSGNLKAVVDLDDDAAGAIASIEVVTKTVPTAQGEEPEVEYLHKFKLADKRAALVDIAKMEGWFNDPAAEEATNGIRALADAICTYAGSMPIATKGEGRDK